MIKAIIILLIPTIIYSNSLEMTIKQNDKLITKSIKCNDLNFTQDEKSKIFLSLIQYVEIKSKNQTLLKEELEQVNKIKKDWISLDFLNKKQLVKNELLINKTMFETINYLKSEINKSPNKLIKDNQEMYIDYKNLSHKLLAYFNYCKKD